MSLKILFKTFFTDSLDDYTRDTLRNAYRALCNVCIILSYFSEYCNALTLLVNLVIMTFSENPPNTFANVSSGQTCTLLLKFVDKTSKGTGNIEKEEI